MINLDGIKTYSNHDALDALALLASRVPEDEAIVEIGVYRGGSLMTIANAAETRHIYGVDTWGLEGAYDSGSENPEKYGLKNMSIATKAVAGRAELVRAFSADFAAQWHTDGKPKIGLLYIDGEHTYDAVMNDFHSWYVNLSDHPTVAFDDYDMKHPEVVDAVDHLVADGVISPVQVFGKRLAVADLS